MMKNNFFDKITIGKQTRCPCCNTKRDNKSVLVLMNLPKYPITEFYRDKKSAVEKRSLIDQKVLFCKKCDHMFLESILDINQVYKNYMTSTSSSLGAIICLKNFYSFIKKNDKKIKNFNLIDIGGNDSTFLKFFKKHKNKKINLDPNGSSDDSNIEVVNSFIENYNFYRFANTKNPVAYFSSHTLEHLENPIFLLQNLSRVLKKKDVLYLQFPSVEKLIEHKKFDQVCHQHINYFSLKSINIVLNKLKLYIHKYEYDTSHFGTLRLKISKQKNSLFKINKINTNLYNQANISYSYFKKYFTALQKNLTNIFKGGQGFGAGLMVPILAYYLPVIDSLEFIVEENKAKVGKKFINMNPDIKNIKSLNVDKPILVTSVSTKEAARNIFKKLSNLGLKDICIPSIII
jgi:hypothetical protein